MFAPSVETRSFCGGRNLRLAEFLQEEVSLLSDGKKEFYLHVRQQKCREDNSGV